MPASVCTECSACQAATEVGNACCCTPSLSLMRVLGLGFQGFPKPEPKTLILSLKLGQAVRARARACRPGR